MILTLWIVVFLALLASAIASQVEAHLQVVSDFKSDVRARAFGMRALAEVMDLLQNGVTNSYGLLNDQTRFKDIPFAGGSFSIVSEHVDPVTGAVEKWYGLTDEEGKVNLNRASDNVLSALFQAAGMALVPANDLAHFIVDWRAQGAPPAGGGSLRPRACAMLEAPYACKNADFEALEELWLMPGMTADVYNVVKPELTLYGSGMLDVNTASSLGLRSLGISPIGAKIIVLWRSGHFFESPQAIMARAAETGISKEDQMKLKTAVATGLAGTDSSVYRAQVEAEFKNRPRKLAEFIIDNTGKVLRWRE